MKCWKCGSDNADVSFCLYCGSSLTRSVPVTNYGKALRKIFDDFGYEKVLRDSRCISSALNDLVSDSDDFIRSLEYVYQIGFGNLYESQIRKGGNPDEEFYKKVKKILTLEAGFSESKSEQMIRCFDEMIGWENSERTNKKPKETTVKEMTASPIIKGVSYSQAGREADYLPIDHPKLENSLVYKEIANYSAVSHGNAINNHTAKTQQLGENRKSKALLFVLIGIITIVFCTICGIIFIKLLVWNSDTNAAPTENVVKHVQFTELEVYSKPSSKSKVIAVLSEGDTVTVKRHIVNAAFSEIVTSDGKKGYCYMLGLRE